MGVSEPVIDSGLCGSPIIKVNEIETEGADNNIDSESRGPPLLWDGMVD